MPSPAVYVNERPPMGPSERRLFNTATGLPLTNWSSYDQSMMVGSVKRLTRPPTRDNPKRKDGTRAMADWDTTFMGIPYVPVTSFAVRIPSTPYEWQYRNYPLVYVRRNPDNQPLIEYLSTVKPLQLLAADSEARTRTLNKLSQKKWDLGVTAVELRQTVGLVRDLAVGMVQTVDKIIHAHRHAKVHLDRFFKEVIRHGDFYQAAHAVGLRDTRLLESIRSMWMSYQFGVKPLVHDIYDSGYALSDQIYKHGLSVLLRAKAGAERVEEPAILRVRGDVEPYPRYTLYGRSEARVHFSVVYELPTGNVGPIQTLGLDNPASLLWEVTRLSWMWDYTVSIGDWLESLTATRNMVFREGCRSQLRRFVSETARLDTWPGGESVPTRERRFVTQGGDFQRTLIGPAGLIPAAMPVPRSDLGLTQLGNALFALSSVAQGKPGLR